MKGLLEKVCVARDEECGVYGFVFLKGERRSRAVHEAKRPLRTGGREGGSEADRE